MDQTAPVNPPQPKPAAGFPKRNIIIIIIIAVIIFILGLTLLLAQSSKKAPPTDPTKPTSKTWELILSFTSKDKSLSFKKLTLLDQTIRPDPRVTYNSSYTLYLLSPDNSILHKQKINITEQILVDYIPGATPSATLPDQLDSVVYIPQIPSVTGIRITSSSTLMLDIKIPPQKTSSVILRRLAEGSLANASILEQVQRFFISFRMTPLAQAQTTGQPLQVVFISDGFTDFNAYHQLVNQIIAKFNSTEPYASANPTIFDFQILDNDQPLGCAEGLLTCTNNPSLIPNVEQIGYRSYPNAGKFAVIINNPNAALTDGGILGAATIGGDVALIVDRLDLPIQTVLKDSIHEVLGHEIGELYDRYVIANPSYNPFKQTIKSNCTDNPGGETFWRDAGVTGGGFRGCINQNYYAPVAPTCPGDNVMASGGTPNSVMSAGGCGNPTGFDLVEQWWIRNHIIPRYQQAINASPSPSPNTSPSSTTTNPAVSSDKAPVVTTDSIPSSTITSTSAVVNGTVVSFRGDYIKIRGVQYYDNSLPYNPCTTVVNGSTTDPNCKYAPPDVGAIGQYGAGPFSKTLTGLLPDHSYTVRAYAVDDNNTQTLDSFTGFATPLSFGQSLSFSVLGQAADNNSGNNTPTSGSSTGNVYTCQEVPSTTTQNGKQLQITKLQCGFQSSSAITSPVTQNPINQNPITQNPAVPIPQSPQNLCAHDNAIADINSCRCAGGALLQCYSTLDGRFLPSDLMPNGGECDELPSAIDGHNWCYEYCNLFRPPPGGIICISKPVVYLYPTKKTNVDVKVSTTGTIVVSDPLYPEGGWKGVEAHPNGDLFYQGKKYRELFYETSVNKLNPLKQGIVIKKENLKQELTVIITKLGLVNDEQTEFLDWWLPRLYNLHSPYIYFSLADPVEKQKADHIEISLKPDTFIEFIAYFKPLSQPISVQPLVLPAQPPKREGFTAVEWGGTIDQSGR